MVTLIDLSDDLVFLRMSEEGFSVWSKSLDTRDLSGWPSTLEHDQVDDISLLKSNGRFETRFESQEAGDQIISHISDGGSVGFAVQKSSWPEWVDFHKSHGAIYEAYLHDTERSASSYRTLGLFSHKSAAEDRIIQDVELNGWESDSEAYSILVRFLDDARVVTVLNTLVDGDDLIEAFLEPEKLKDFFEDEEFSVHPFEQDGQQCAEVEKWTAGGVDMVFSLQPFTKESFIERVDDFDVDEEIELHRQGDDYRRAFTTSEGLKDFTDFHNHLKEVASRLEEL